MKPMLAVQCELAQLKYPLYASPKLDGVRGVVIGGVLHSRSLKLFPNQHVHSLFSKPEYNGLDGELILGDPRAKDVFRVTSAACQRHEGTPDMRFYVFDRYDQPGTFIERWADQPADFGPPIIPVAQYRVDDEAQLLQLEAECLAQGFEGLILRSPDGPYKFGRSTLREGWMLKLKRFLDSEAEIIEVIEEMENTNEKKTSELGRSKRSSHQAGLVPKGVAGAFRVKDCSTGVEFVVGTGLTDEDGINYWRHRHQLPGKILKYKYFPVGVKDAPRFPVFLGMREAWDMGEAA